MDVINDLDVNDFLFRAQRRFRFFPPFNESVYSENYYHLTTVSNDYGLLFVAKGKELKVVETSIIHEKSELTKQNAKQEIVDFPCKLISLEFDIAQVRCNSDGSMLAVIVHSSNEPFALFYDVRHLTPKLNVAAKPICQFRLSSSIGSKLVCFEWNPAIPEIFSFCCSDGNAAVVQINERKSISIQGSLPPSSVKPTCLSWSPKGKQIVIGYNDCTLCQFKPNLQPVKKIDSVSESVVKFIPGSVINVCWLSTTHFAVLYKAKDPSNGIALCHVTLNKEGPPIFLSFGDVCFGRGTTLMPNYYFIHVQEWALLICSSTTSLETAVLGYNAEEKCWQLWNLDDSGRAELLLGDKGEFSFPLGIAFDTTSQKPSYISSEKTFPPAPVLFILSTDGLVCPFAAINMKDNAQSFCKPPQAISLDTSQLPVQREIFVPPLQKLPQLPSEQVTISQVPSTVALHSPNVAQVQTPKQAEETANIEEKRFQRLRQEVNQIICKVEEDLKKLKIKLSSVIPPTLNNKDVLVNLTRNFNENCKTVENLEIVINLASSNLAELQKRNTNAWVVAEELRVSLDRMNSREMKYFWKTRPLSASNEKVLEHFRHQIKIFEENLNQASTNLKKFSTDNLMLADKTKSAGVNSGALVYRTLVNIQAIITQQRQRLAELKRLPSTSNNSLNVSQNESSSNLDIRFEQSSVRANDSFQSFTSNAENQGGLRRFLMSRTVVPRRTTTPKLSYPDLDIKAEENTVVSINVPKVSIEEKGLQNKNSSKIVSSIASDEKLVQNAVSPKFVPTTSFIGDNAKFVPAHSSAAKASGGIGFKSLSTNAPSTPVEATTRSATTNKKIDAVSSTSKPAIASSSAFTVVSQSPSAAPQKAVFGGFGSLSLGSTSTPKAELPSEERALQHKVSSKIVTPTVTEGNANSSIFAPTTLTVGKASADNAASSKFVPTTTAIEKLSGGGFQSLSTTSAIETTTTTTISATLFSNAENVSATSKQPVASSSAFTVVTPSPSVAPQSSVFSGSSFGGMGSLSLGSSENDPDLDMKTEETTFAMFSLPKVSSEEKLLQNPVSFKFTPTTPTVGKVSGAGFKSLSTISSSTPGETAATRPTIFADPTIKPVAPAVPAFTFVTQSPPVPTQSSAFGATSFGGFGSLSIGGNSAAPNTDGSSAFGGKPTFGGGSTFAGSPFGNTTGSPFGAASSSPGKIFGGGFGSVSPSAPSAGGGGFASFLNKDMPTFGSLAGGSPQQAFGTVTGAQSGFGSLSSGSQSFGSLGGSGGQAFGSFGGGVGQQPFGTVTNATPPTFGSFGNMPQQQNQSPPQQQSSFSQWRG